MVGGHEINGAGAQQAHAVELTPVQQKLQKPRVILCGGDQAAAARGQRGVGAHVDHFHLQAAIRVTRKRLGNVAVELGWHGKRGVWHAQWIEDVLLHVLLQGLPGDGFHHAAQHIGGAAVLKHLPRLVHQG